MNWGKISPSDFILSESTRTDFSNSGIKNFANFKNGISIHTILDARVYWFKIIVILVGFHKTNMNLWVFQYQD